MQPIAAARPRTYARIAGALYLIVIVAGIFAEIFVRSRLVVSGLAEVFLCLWLLVMGVNEERWREQAAA